MHIYWFWPFVHSEDLVVPGAVARPGDELVLHTMQDRAELRAFEHPGFRVAPTLAAVGGEQERTARWALARTATYTRRIVQRRRLLREGAFDVCHVVFLNYFTDWFDLRRIARRMPLVFEVHDVMPHQSRVPDAAERALLRLQYDAPGRIVVRHEHIRTRLHEEFGVDPARVTVVPWHIPDLGKLPRAAFHGDGFHDERTVLFFGALRRNKGVDVMLAAIEELRDRSGIRFVFAGRGFADVEAAIRTAAARDDRIVFEQGFIPATRKDELYEAADLVVLPYTEFDSMSAVLADAYSQRVPVVVSDVGALGSSVRADGTGWVVPAGDARALAAAVDTAVTDRAPWLEATQATVRASQARTPERVAAQLRALYDTLA